MKKTALRYEDICSSELGVELVPVGTSNTGFIRSEAEKELLFVTLKMM